MATPISLSALKPPMPGPWPARGSTTTNGPARGIDLDSLRRNDAHQQVIHRPLQRPAIHHQLGLVVEDVGNRSRRDGRDTGCCAGASHRRTTRCAAPHPSCIRRRDRKDRRACCLIPADCRSTFFSSIFSRLSSFPSRYSMLRSCLVDLPQQKCSHERVIFIFETIGTSVRQETTEMQTQSE